MPQRANITAKLSRNGSGWQTQCLPRFVVVGPFSPLYVLAQMSRVECLREDLCIGEPG